MIRFILSREMRHNGGTRSRLETLDVDVPQLQESLERGGFGGGVDDDDYDNTHLIGAEVRTGDGSLVEKEE